MNHCARLSAITALGAAGLAAAVASAPKAEVQTETIGFEKIGENDPLRQQIALPGQADHPCVIFAPDTPMERVIEVTTALHGQSGERFVPEGSTWFGEGNGGTLTYSFPSDGLTIPDAVNGGTGTNNLNSTLANQFGNTDAGKDQFRDAFNQWDDLINITYQEVSDDSAAWGAGGNNNRGDVRIGMINIDGSGGVLAYNMFPSGGGDMVLDSAENWGSSFGNFRFLRNTVAHEHGHGMGLLHVCPIQESKLMEPFLSTAFDGPQHDDIRGSTFLYGDRFEDNDSSGSAASLGAFGFGDSATEENLSMRNDQDIDVYSIDVPDNARVSVDLAPFGFVYQQAPQDFFCNSGDSFNSLTIIDLRLEVLDSDGSTVLASSNSGGFGDDESVSEVDLVDAGTYFIRVSPAAANGVAQIYTLDVAVTEGDSIPCPADLDGDGVVGSGDLAILLGDWNSASSPADLDGSGAVGSGDLAIVLGDWGACP